MCFISIVAVVLLESCTRDLCMCWRASVISNGHDVWHPAAPLIYLHLQGDVLLKIDNQHIRPGMAVHEASSYIRGKLGSSVYIRLRDKSGYNSHYFPKMRERKIFSFRVLIFAVICV